jgi:hypothetical protein
MTKKTIAELTAKAEAEDEMRRLHTPADVVATAIRSSRSSIMPAAGSKHKSVIRDEER